MTMAEPIPLNPLAPRAPGPGAQAATASPRPAPAATAPTLKRLTADERAFLPAALEVIETPPSPAIRSTALTVCGLLTAALAWSCFAHVDLVAVASGKVVPLGQTKVVQPLETSAISAICVDDGDHVTAGEVLVELDPTDVTTDLAA
jgi:hemolysin D